MCQQLGQPRGCLIGWVKVTTCLPARLRDAVVSLPTYVRALTCTASAHASSRARGNAELLRAERERESELAKSRVGAAFLSESEIAPRYVCDVNFAIVIRVLEPESIPRHDSRGLNLRFRINICCKSLDNARSSPRDVA